MDFIERIFGISPDAGSGVLEVLIFLVPIAAIALLSAWRRARRRAAD